MSREEKIKELLLNESFVGELKNLKSAEELQEAFKNNGVDMTLEEINALGDLCEKALEEMDNDELSEENLSSVSGGVTDRQMKAFVWGILKQIHDDCVRDLKKAIFGR